MTNEKLEYYVPTGYKFVTNIRFYKKGGRITLSGHWTENYVTEEYQTTIDSLHRVHGDVAVIPALDIYGNDISESGMYSYVGLCVPIMKK